MPIVTLANLRMSYLETGTGEPVVLLHGLGSSSRDWEDQLPALGSRYRVIAPDLRGHGQTEKLAHSSIPDMAADVAQLLQALGVGPAHVVGISMGGMVALQLALDAPDRVRSLVIVNSGPDAIPRTLRVRFAVYLRFVMLRFLGMRRSSAVIARRLFPDPEQHALRQRFIERVSTNDPVAYRAALRAITRWSVADRLSEVHMRTLVVSADQDYTPVALKQQYVAQLPDAKLVVIAGSRHATPIDQPERFNATVLEFLDGMHEQRAAGVTGTAR